MYVYDHTHFCFHARPIKAQNCTLARQTFGATDLKHGMHTQLDLVSNMGGMSPGYTSFHWCVKKKVSKKELLTNAWTKGVTSMNVL